MDLLENANQSQFQSYRIAQTCAMLHAVCGVAMWCYSPEGALYFTTSGYKEELSSFFSVSGCKEWILEKGRQAEAPVVMSDELGFVWIGEFVDNVVPVGEVVVVLGPMYSSAGSVKTLEQLLREHQSAPNLQAVGSRILARLPVVPVPMMNQYACMLHFAITEKTISPEEFVYQSRLPLSPAMGREQERHYLDYESEFANEELMLQYVRDGNLNYGNAVQDIRHRTMPDDFMTGDSLREAKDNVIMFTAKCAKAAVEGGVSPKQARQMQQETVRRAEETRTLTELSELNHQTYERFILMVHDLRGHENISKPVQIACDYIKAHFMEPIRLEDLARASCYSEYYLSRKFQKEMGIRLSDYIRDTRLEYAKIWLLSTEKTVEEISEQLQFCSRNYFSRVFREKEGVSPQEFRDSAKVIRKVR